MNFTRIMQQGCRGDRIARSRGTERKALVLRSENLEKQVEEMRLLHPEKDASRIG